jgi:hypothetical protein
MNSTNSVEPPGSGEPLDALDLTIMQALRDLWQKADPMPSGLLDQVRLAIDVDQLDAELARMTELDKLVGVRGDECSKMITFDSESCTIMVSMHVYENGMIRLDGWLTPAACHPIELRGIEHTMQTSSDDAGRFVLDRIEPGMAQIVVRPTGQTRSITTPMFTL